MGTTWHDCFRQAGSVAFWQLSNFFIHNEHFPSLTPSGPETLSYEKNSHRNHAFFLLQQWWCVSGMRLLTKSSTSFVGLKLFSKLKLDLTCEMEKMAHHTTPPFRNHRIFDLLLRVHSSPWIELSLDPSFSKAIISCCFFVLVVYWLFFEENTIILRFSCIFWISCCPQWSKVAVKQTMFPSEADPRQVQIAGSLANGLMFWALPETPSSWARALSSLKKRRSSTLAYHIYPMLREVFGDFLKLLCCRKVQIYEFRAVSQILGIWNPWMCDVGNIWNTCYLSWWRISAEWWVVIFLTKSVPFRFDGSQLWVASRSSGYLPVTSQCNLKIRKIPPLGKGETSTNYQFLGFHLSFQGCIAPAFFKAKTNKQVVWSSIRCENFLCSKSGGNVPKPKVGFLV